MRWLLIFALALMLSACTSTKYVPVESVRTEYVHGDNSELLNVIKSLTERLHQKEQQVDSLMQSYRELLVLSDKGDTLRHDREKIVYRASHRESELEKLVESKNDSIRELLRQLESVKSDSIRVPYPVERKLSRWEQAKMDFGGMAIGATVLLVVFVIAWLIKRYARHA
ncbi:hypothetical protein [uncultured Muribaculum sp.]|uniref:hypothetical protein n=1 Tax=uncultured Muribaculum sp. TaxID=1918613 RepID=UPI0025B15315|nr:hypothetical protein [uncultured Muribaculum sp.]